MNLELRDPGGNLLKGYKPVKPRNELELTEAVYDTLVNSNGINIDGYRDYRGVQVLGIWKWNSTYNFGLVTEIDNDEGYLSYFTARNNILTALIVSLIISITSILLSIITGVRSNNALKKVNDGLEVIVEERTEALSLEIEKKVETEMKLRKLSVAVEEGPSMVFVTDEFGKIEYVNSKFIELTGYAAKEVIGQKAAIFGSGYHEKEFFLEMWDTIKLGKEWRGEILNKRKDGALIWNLVSISSVRNDADKIVNYIFIAENITERKKTEEELKNKLEELELFNKLTIERELKMIDLKREINELLVQSNHPGKYEITD